MLVVLDSNVIVSSFIARAGICNLVYELCLLKHEVLLSKEIIKEVKSKLRGKFKYKKAEADDLTSLL